MKAVVQRCLNAHVSVGGGIIGEIQKGSVVFLGISSQDTQNEIEYMADKIIGLRIFEDSEGKTNLCLSDVGGELLIVPNFTIYGNVRKGKRPSFIEAAPPQISKQLFEDFVRHVSCRFAGKVETGEFGAEMKVSVVNDGPFTLIIESINK